MSTEVVVNVARDFSRFPAGRYSSDGPFSGEEFRRKLLQPHLERDERIVVDLDGALGYGSSFLEEAFGGLIRAGYAAADLLRKVSFKSKDESLIKEIKDYIQRASKLA